MVDMQLISKFNTGTRFLLCLIDIFKKYAWIVPLKSEKGITIVNAFQKISDNSTKLNLMGKSNKIWEEKGSEFYNSSFEKWLKHNDTEIYSTHNEGESVVAERFIRTLKNKLYKHVTAASKNIDKLDDIENE